jgi:hypothetical protein
MESFSINLNQAQEKGKRFKKYILLLGIIYVVTSAVLFFIMLRRNDPKEWIFLINGIYALGLIAFGFWGHKQKFYINGDDYALEYQFGFFSKVPERIIWQTITKVRIGPAYIAFYKRTGKRKVVQLSWLPYAKVMEIKTKIQEFTTEKGLEVEIADFQRG